jgi:hypothetical protein
MKKISILATVILSVFLIAGNAFSQQAPPNQSEGPSQPKEQPKEQPKADNKTANIDGKWTMTVDAGGQIIDLAVEIKQTGEDFIGSMASMVGNGSFDKGKVNGYAFKAMLNADLQGSPTTIEMEGKLEGENINGTLSVPGIGVIPFTGARPK